MCAVLEYRTHKPLFTNCNLKKCIWKKIYLIHCTKHLNTSLFNDFRDVYVHFPKMSRPLFFPSNSQTLKDFKDPWEPWCMKGWLNMLLFSPFVMWTSTEDAYLYSEEASCAAIGTNLENRSGPVTLGSVGFTGRAFTSGAPLRAERSWFYWDRNT